MIYNKLFDCNKQARILIVGVGGIGCEIIKNLIQLGFKNLLLVDYDKIDITNLNRQFFF